ncbi:MAG TPA: branched-chain amino acid ABC transporter permease [Microbacteriaceae bacterium]|nr:branched-chain amino acid ABC transporter permease [Microbacteriaceae bacterium]
MDVVINEVLSILSSAAIASVIALGLGITFRLMGIINLAHGEFMMIGAYAAVYAGAIGLPWPLGLLAGVLAAAVVGALAEVLIVRWLYSSPELSILGTYGLSIVLIQGVQVTLGKGYLYSSNPFPGAIEVFGVAYPIYRLVLIGAAAVLFLIILLLLNATPLGTKIRAVAADGKLAETLGIRSSRLNLVVFTASAALAGLAGVLVGPLGNVRPDMGADYIFTAFVIVIIAGNSIVRLIPAAILVSTVQNLMTFWIDPMVAKIAVLVIALLVLQGLRRTPGEVTV